ncbi:MAG: MBL fold metallo-hydrolase [Clostridia bacterium]|nr:MBL fold metallo-hydrolase [Clostridia bacterium]
MELTCLRVPPLGTNCYFIVSGTSLAIVDPGGAADALIQVISEKALTPSAIWLTHGHFDHADAAGKLKAHFGIPIYIHRLDAPMLENAETSHAAKFGLPYNGCEADVLFEEGDTLSVGNETFTVLHTPGHTPGSACFLSGNTLISGDTLFRRSIGKFDRENKDMMKESIRRLLLMDENIRVYPGHEGETTIGEERRGNPFANMDWEWV